MEDDDLKQLRAKRMAELQGAQGVSLDLKILWARADRWTPFQGGGDQQQQAMEERRAQVEDMKHSILSQVLSQEARARCKPRWMRN